MNDPLQILESAVKLARDAAELTREAATGGITDIEEEDLTLNLVELATQLGMPPMGVAERSLYIKEIVGEPPEPETVYWLCTLEDRELLPGVPGMTTISGPADLQYANRGVEEYGLVYISEADLEAEQEIKRQAEKIESAKRFVANRYGITVEAWEALCQYAKENGTRWKSKLRAEWEAGTAGELLQWLRNHHSFGPKGLVKFRLPNPKNHYQEALICDAWANQESPLAVAV